RQAYEHTWSAMPGRERAKYLFRIARIIAERARELAVLESLDNGKPIRESRDVDIPLVAAHFFYHAGWADKLEYAGYGPAPRPLGQEGDPRAGRQSRQRRVRGRARGPGGRGHRERHLLQPGPRLLRGLAAAGAGVGVRRGARVAAAAAGHLAARRSAGQEHRCRRHQLRRPAGQDPRAVRGGRGRRRTALVATV